MASPGSFSQSSPVATPPPAPARHWVKKVIACEYRCWYVRNDSTLWAYNNASPYPVQFPIGGRKAVAGAGGFNKFRVLDDRGYIWTSKIDYTTNSVRTEKDTLGAPFNHNWYVDAFGHVAVTIRSDSSIWYFGVDAFSLFYPKGDLSTMTGVTMAPTRLSPAGMKFKKVLLGGNKIIGLTTKGQVFQWVAGGSRTPAQMTIPRPACNIFLSGSDVAGCIIPDPGGKPSMGYPYVWGLAAGMWGGSAPSAQPIPLKTLWKMTAPIKEITATFNTIHYIDSLGRMFGIGFNPMGEVGNGQEFVNKYDYPGYPGYGWDFQPGEHPSGAPPAQIGVGITWKHLYANNWFTFYTYAQDSKDSIYSWGRNKALVLGNGLECMQEVRSYDAFDIIKPTMVHPLTARWQTYNLTLPSIHVSSDPVTTNSTILLKGSATPPLLIKATPLAFNGIDTAGYKIVSWQWTKKKGAGGRITAPTAARTTVTGLTQGVYTFNLLTTDSNTGTQSADITITVKAPGPVKKE